MNLSSQKQCLEEMSSTVENLIVKGKSSLMQWQKGMIIYCNGLPKLFDDMVRQYQVNHIFTMRTNQDGIENLFSQLRFLGGNDRTFGSVKLETLLRNFILGSGHQIPIEKASVMFSADPAPEEQLMVDDLTMAAASSTAATSSVTEPVSEPLSLEDQDSELEVPIASRVIAVDMKKAIEPVKKVQVSYVNDPIDSVRAMLDQCDEGKDDTILSFPIPEQEGFIAMTASLQNPPQEDKDITEYEDFVPSVWLQMRRGNGQPFIAKDLVNKLVLMNNRFILYHKDHPNGISREKGVVKNFCEVLKADFPECDEELLKKFAYKRTMCRLKAIQRKLADEQEETLRARTKLMHYSRY